MEETTSPSQQENADQGHVPGSTLSSSLVVGYKQESDRKRDSQEPESQWHEREYPGSRLEKASLGRRFLAACIDGIILALIEGGITLLTNVEETSWWWIVSMLIPAVYYVRAYSTSGQTQGKSMLGIKVVSIDGSPLNLLQGILRWIGYLPSGILLGLGYFWAIWDADRQAWHDKIAGTCVVPKGVAPEQLQGTITPTEARHRQKRWLLGLGIPTALIVALGIAGFSALIVGGMAEVRAMRPWPGPQASPGKVAAADLSHLGLTQGQTLNAQDDGMWVGGHYEEGVVVTYTKREQIVVCIWALRYRDNQVASEDFSAAVAWSEESCGVYSSAYLGNAGVVRCRTRDGCDRTFRNDRWIVDILALEGAEFAPEALVDEVCEALAAHWAEIAER